MIDNINEKLIRISGLLEVENDLELGEDVKIHLTGQVVKIEHLDNQDGTVNKKIIIKPFGETVIEKDTTPLPY